MRKMFLFAAAILMMAGLSAKSSASPSVLWTCGLEASVHDFSAAVGIGAVIVSGAGTIHCRDSIGQTKNMPVVVRMAGVSFGPNIDVSLLKTLVTGQSGVLKIKSLNLGVANPKDMYGEFSLEKGANAQVLDIKLGVGAGVSVTPINEAAAEISLQAEGGASLGLGAYWSITGMTLMTPSEARFLDNGGYYREHMREREASSYN